MGELFKKAIAGKHWMQSFLVVAWTFCAIAYIFVTTLCELPEKNIQIISTNQNFLFMTVVAAIVYFAFGSSKSSQDKNELIEKQKE